MEERLVGKVVLFGKRTGEIKGLVLTLAALVYCSVKYIRIM